MDPELHVTCVIGDNGVSAWIALPVLIHSASALLGALVAWIVSLHMWKSM